MSYGGCPSCHLIVIGISGQSIPLCCIGFLPIAAAARGWRLLRVLKRGRLEGGKKTRATVIA
jgi:hypothetical protein